MNELNVMNKKILNYSLVIVAIVCIIAILLFHDGKIVVGILAGIAIALTGYHMIISMTLSLRPDEKSGQKQGYVLRYLFYICAFVVMVVLGIPVLALLAGFLCHKAAILLYVVLNREGDDHD